MTLHQLRVFVTLAEAGSVRAAAKRLHVTQPAVSSALAALQRSLGVALLEPEGRGVRLTPAGGLFAERVRTVIGLLDEAEAVARGGHDPRRGRLRIAAVTTASEHVVPAFLASFAARFPSVDLRLGVVNKERIWDLMARHEADVAICGRPPEGAGVRVCAQRRNDLVVVAAERPRASRDGPLPLATLAGLTWLLREPGSGTRETLLALLASHEITPRTLTLGSNGAVVAAAAAGLGITLISRDAVGQELAEGSLRIVPVEGTPLERPWLLVTQATPSPTAQLFAAHVLDPDVAYPAPRFTAVR